MNMFPTQPRKIKPLYEYGKIGQHKYGGIFFEEYQQELIGLRGVEVYKEMADGDDMIGAIMFAIEMLLRQTKFDVQQAGDKAIDKEAAGFVKQCMNDMTQTWQDTLSEILSFLTFGWSYHEICYKRRLGKKDSRTFSSKYNDGLIGWSKIPIRSQDTLLRWEYDENDELIGMTQLAPPDFEERFIPLQKALHFITKSRKWNPEGRSILRNAYNTYYYKKRMLTIEGIGVERDLAGLPMLQPPEGINLWDEDDETMVQQRMIAEAIVQNVRRDATEGLVIPPGWTFSLLSGGSRRQFEIGNIIERYDRRMAMTVMADFILLGSSNVGSFALSSDKTALFSVALGTYLDIICQEFNNHAIPQLIDLNGDKFKGITDYPKMVHGDIEKPDIEKMSTFIETMTGIGLITPDENLESYVRRLGDLPEPVSTDDEGEKKLPAPQKPQSDQKTPSGGENDTQTADNEKGGNDTSKAKKDDSGQPTNDREDVKKHMADTWSKM